MSVDFHGEYEAAQEIKSSPTPWLAYVRGRYPLASQDTSGVRRPQPGQIFTKSMACTCQTGFFRQWHRVDCFMPYWNARCLVCGGFMLFPEDKLDFLGKGVLGSPKEIHQ